MSRENNQPTSRIPQSYAPAAWRGTLPVDAATERIGVSFDLESGETIRLSLDVKNAQHLAESIGEFLEGYRI